MIKSKEQQIEEENKEILTLNSKETAVLIIWMEKKKIY
jgi:hypothetical protein